MRTFRSAALVLVALAPFVPASRPAAKTKTENVILVMIDGLRWQEVFNGGDAALMTKAQGVSDADAVKKEFWRDAPETRRETLMPFFWGTIAKRGQIYGNRAKGSEASVTNGKKFSYPGYSEVLCGFADPRIDSNDKVPNPNVTVLEWLHGKPAFHGRVAAFGMWDVLPSIVNRDRCGFTVTGGAEAFTPARMTPRLELLNELKREAPTDWAGTTFDAFACETALEFLRESKPRVLFLLLGETDEWAHERKYGRYLDAARRADGMVAKVWEAAQAMPEMRGTTTLIVMPDHGRGATPETWPDHGRKVEHAEQVWLGVLGPDTAPLGERSACDPITSSQVAATIAALLGEDYVSAVSKAGKPIADALPR